MPDPTAAARSPDPAPEPTPRSRTDLLLAILVVIWGLNFAVVKAALAEWHPLAFNALRFVLAGAFLLIVQRARAAPAGLAPIARRDWPALIALGVLGNTVYQVFFILGLDATLAGNSALVLSITPVFITLLSVTFRHERVSPVAWAGVTVSFAGVALVIAGGTRVAFAGHTVRGDLLTLAASACWALYTVALSPYVRRYGALRMTATTLYIGGAVLVLVALPFLRTQEWTRIGVVGWGGLLYGGILAIGVAYLLWYSGVKRIGSTRTAVHSNLVPAVALVVAWLGLGETPTWLQIGGALAIFAGVALTRRGRVH
ncbi:MAG: DMT family transporter [Gemmatimonadota bacterium]